MEQDIIFQTDQQSGDIARLAKGAGVSAGGKLVGRGLNFLGQVIFARVLGPEAFGLYSIGWTILRMISVVGPLGFDSGVIRFGAKYWPDGLKKFRYVFWVSSLVAFVSGLLIGIALFLTAPFLSIQVFHKPGLQFILRGFAFAIPLVTTLRIFSSATTVSQRLQYATYSEEISQPGSAILFFVILFLLFGLKVEGAVWSEMFSFIVAIALAAYYLSWLFPIILSRGIEGAAVNRAVLNAELVRFSIPTAFAALFGSFISWADRLLVGYFRSGAETGIYSTISLVSIIFVVILSGIKGIYAPMIADLHNKQDMGRARELYRVSTKWGLYIGIPLFLIILFASREILGVVFGPEYALGSLPLIVLAFSQLVNIGTGPMDILLVMTGRQKTWLAMSGIMLAVNIIANSILIPALGILGAAIGTASTVCGIFIIGLIIIKRQFNIWPYDRRFLKGGLSAVITAAALFGISRIGITSPIIFLISISVSAFLVFSAGLFLLGVDKEDKEIFGKFRRKFNF